MTDRPELPAEIDVLPGTAVEDAWERFHLFEALHYGLRICNPLGSTALQRVVDAMAPEDGDAILDVACGHGELLIRCAEAAAIEGVGVDLSPWALIRAYTEAESRGVSQRLRWMLGQAAEFDETARWAVVSGLGMSWIWDGFEGTLKALASRTKPGGRIAFGDLQRITGETPADVPDGYDPVLSRPEQLAVMARLGLEVVTEVVPDAGDWAAQELLQADAADRYAREHPGKRAEAFRHQQAEWSAAHAGDTDHLTWTVWILGKGEA